MTTERPQQPEPINNIEVARCLAVTLLITCVMSLSLYLGVKYLNNYNYNNGTELKLDKGTEIYGITFVGFDEFSRMKRNDLSAGIFLPVGTKFITTQTGRIIAMFYTPHGLSSQDITMQLRLNYISLQEKIRDQEHDIAALKDQITEMKKLNELNELNNRLDTKVNNKSDSFYINTALQIANNRLLYLRAQLSNKVYIYFND